MANRIKGITVEINGDTTKLSKALESVNKNIRSTQSQLKDVEKLLKLDPTNTELLSQKQKLLADAVSSTKDKLETLKTAAKQANTALANGDITQEQYDALQREIIETEHELQSLEQQAKQSGTALTQMAQTGEKLKTVGTNISNAGQALLPLTGVVMGLGTAAVKTGMDFDAAMSKVSSVSGATGEELQSLRDKAREMGSKTKFSASEAAEAMNYMAMAGWKTTDMLSGIDGVMNLAAASGEDLATTSDIVTDALTAFGLTAADSGHFADVLAAASSNANTNVSMMGETFKYAAPVAGSLGFSVEDTAEAIGLMANAGIKSTQAGTSLRSVMTALAGEVKICGESIGEVEIQTTNADGSMRELSDILADCRTAFSGLSESEQASAAQALVGKNAMSGFLALMNAAPQDIEKLSGAISDCDGTSLKMAETMQDNLAGQLTILQSALQELAISFSDILMPAVRDIVSNIQNLVDKFNSLDDKTKTVIAKIKGSWYAFHPNTGVLYKNSFYKDKNGYYYLAAANGKLRTGFFEVNSRMRYFDPPTCRMVMGWKTINGAKYYFNTKDGSRYENCRLKQNGKLYFFRSNGKLYKSKWFTRNGRYFYAQSDGSLATGWLTYQNNKYYMNLKSGARSGGWMTISGKKYYFNPTTGIMARNTWIDSTHYVGANGVLVTGVVCPDMRWPLHHTWNYITSYFGTRESPGGIGSTNHRGIDITANMNTPIYAAADGFVKAIIPTSQSGGAGNYTIIDHSHGIETEYMHQNRFLPGLKVGDTIKKGQPIGYVGSTGNSTGPHLHFGVIVNGERKNPLDFVKRP